MKVIGIMSGSSLDGIDVACVEMIREPLRFELICFKTYKLPEQIKKGLSSSTQLFAFGLAKLESSYTNFICDIVNEFINENNLDINLIGVHGHTILHYPELNTSWQFINAAMLCERTNTPTVSDFRNQDMAIGGQGTPMAVLADRDLFPGYSGYINLGGIANISAKNEDNWMAYDLCPCNQLLNYFSQKSGFEFDKNGELAALGKVNTPLLKELTAFDYIKKAPPKSLDNSWIKEIFIKSMLKHELSIRDFLRTGVEFISSVIAQNCSIQNSKILFTGGGTKNKFLMRIIEEKLNRKAITAFLPSSEIIDFKESILIAYAAYLRWNMRPNFVSTATGALNDTIGGALYIPSGK